MGGLYCENVEIAKVVADDEVKEWHLGDSLITTGVMPHAVNPTTAEHLWNESQRLLDA